MSRGRALPTACLSAAAFAAATLFAAWQDGRHMLRRTAGSRDGPAHDVGRTPGLARKPALAVVLVPWSAGVGRDVLVAAAVFTIPHAVAWSGTRLRTPLEPFLLALAAIGAAAAWDRLRRREG